MAQSKTLNFGPFNSVFLRGDQLHTCSGNTHKQETQTQAATASLPGLGSDILCLHVPYSSPSPPPPAHHRRDSDCFRQTRAHLQSPDTPSGGETPRRDQAALCTGGTSASALGPHCSPLVATSCFTHFPCLYDPAGEEELAPPSRTLAGRIPWTEEPGRLQSTGLQRGGHS